MRARSRFPRLVALACRCYSLVIWTYPATLQRDYGREILLTFRNDAEDALNDLRPRTLFRFAVRIGVDWVRTLANGTDDPLPVSLLGLRAGDSEAYGSLDSSTWSVGLLLATLGVVLLITGWYEWLHYNGLFLRNHSLL
jgi:hypothetical protein